MRAEGFGPRLRAARQSARLTLTEVSERAGVHEETIGRIERGGMDPKLSTVVAITTRSR